MQKSQHTALYRKMVLELKVARIRAGLTQRDVAKKLKVYRNYVSKVESGERKLDVLELAEFCHLYGVTLSEFLKTVGVD